MDRSRMKAALLKRSKKSAENKGFQKGSILKDNVENLKLWRCKDGEHIIDIIPYEAGGNDSITDEGDPTYCYEFYVHRDLGPTEDQRCICLAETFGEACPVCEHRKQLMKDGADDDIWKPLLAKQRNMYNIVCYDTEKSEDQGVMVWEVAWFYMEKHLTKLAKGPMQRGGKRGRKEIDPNIAFADPDSGRSISFEVAIKKGKDSYPEYSAHQFLTRDYEIDDETLDNAHSLDEIIEIPTYGEVYELYWGESVVNNEPEPEPEPEPEKKTSSRRGKSKKNNLKPKDDKKNTNECPNDFIFGEDNGLKPECEDCDPEIWEKCVELNSSITSKSEPEPELEPEPEKKTSSRRGGSSRRSGNSKRTEPEKKTSSRRSKQDVNKTEKEPEKEKSSSNSRRRGRRR